jgi:hypothetical protein
MTANSSEELDFKYDQAEEVDPLELIGNACLSLHHHMSPPDAGFDLEAEEED